jgi:Co/Zn/Cd efflux system component
MYTTILFVFGAIEGLFGFWLGNVHIVRDFLTSLLMVGSLILSYESAQSSRAKKSAEQTYGSRRLNIIAAFVNCVYIQCTVLFSLLETLHHIIEHWDLAQHTESDFLNSSYHESSDHQGEIRLYISVFSLLRLLVFVN